MGIRRGGPAAGATRYLRRFDRNGTMRWAARGALLGVAAALAIEAGMVPDRGNPAAAIETAVHEAAPPLGLRAGEPLPASFLQPATANGEFFQPMRFELAAAGVLAARGSIGPGAAGRLDAELQARGGQVRAIAFDSPGGSLDDAMAIARLIRERGIDTRVADGAICASSCPLALAGGVARSVGAGSRIGLHQFYADMAATSSAQAMSDAQMTTARISRYLAEMGVDPALWLHALDTPPQWLYFLSSEEMRRYRLVTMPEVAGR